MLHVPATYTLRPINSVQGQEITFNQQNQAKYLQPGKLHCNYTEVSEHGIIHNANKELTK